MQSGNYAEIHSGTSQCTTTDRRQPCQHPPADVVGFVWNCIDHERLLCAPYCVSCGHKVGIISWLASRSYRRRWNRWNEQ